jgi:hypothetical protein
MIREGDEEDLAVFSSGRTTFGRNLTFKVKLINLDVM